MKIFSTSREAVFFLTRPALWFRKPLDESKLPADPLELFNLWFDQAKRQWFGEFPNWFCLSTVNASGVPEGRIVLLKEHSKDGFIFYTNMSSQKGQSIENNPQVSMTFFWERLQHQVRITGAAKVIDDKKADAYFQSRPRRSQLAAVASLQSEVLDSRNTLSERMKSLESEFKNKAIPRPEDWTGYAIKPVSYEFWELRISRLHDRILYKSEDDGVTWNLSRLYP